MISNPLDNRHDIKLRNRFSKIKDTWQNDVLLLIYKPINRD